MHKLKMITLCIAACFILLTMGSCNFPGLTAGGDGSTTEAIPTVHVEPSAPTNTDGAETIRIPGGTFQMGSAETDLLAGEDERPVHAVTVGTFYLYTHEVTNEMYTACVDAGACIPVNVMDSGPTTHISDVAYANYPATGVDWNMAKDYCAWSGGRLPTEAEWEYAARGSESLLFPWGSEQPACDRTNMLGCLVPPDTVAVGTYLLGNSPFEVWDLAGNVWEWVNDWYAAGYYALSPASNPLGPYSYMDPAHPLKVVRGGGLYSGPEQMRSADRAGTNPYRAYDDVGFRCVAEGEGALNLPSEYIETRDRHEMVPPDPLDGGGDPLDDPDEGTPDWWIEEYFATSSCPDPEGNIFLAIGIEAAPGTLFGRVHGVGVEFDCTYDEMLHVLNCEGPVPEEYEEDEDTFRIWIEVRNEESDIWRTYRYWVEKPDTCDELPSMEPWNLSVTATCPAGGWITVIVESDIPFEPENFESEGHDLACWSISPTQVNCLLPVDPGDPARREYPVYSHGLLDGYHPYVFSRSAIIPEDCPVVPRTTSVEPFCFEGQPVVHVGFSPLGTVLESAISFGLPLGCIGMTPVDMYCGPLPGEAGIPSSVTTCFVDETCETWPINVPDCSGPSDAYMVTVTPTCYDTLGPVLVINYAPSDQLMVSASANGTDLTCYDAPEPGWYMCSGVPGAAGNPLTVEFCLEDGTCFSEASHVSDCGLAHWDEDWRLIAVACTDVATDISFMIDTGLDWLVPGAGYTYSAVDGEGSYFCSVHPTVAGRIYCAGPRPEDPGNLEFCLQRDGAAAPTCESFDIYPGWVAETPACAGPGAEEPVDPCSVFTDPSSCWKQKDVCHWIDTAPAHCESIP